MIFIGDTFLGDGACCDYTPTHINQITKMTIRNGIFDDIYITSNTGRTYTAEIPPEIPQDWDFDTILHALFQGTLHAGNVDYTAANVSEMRVKCREYGTYDWVTLYQIPINSVEDFNFERFDLLRRAKTWYEYALVPVTDNVEGNLNITRVYSDFDGIFLIGDEQVFTTFLNTSISTQVNHPNTAITTLGRKYPCVISSGESNYISGSISGTFLEFDRSSCELKPQEGWRYRKRLMEFLGDGKPKLIKLRDGRMWLSSIVGAPTESSPAHEDMPVTGFEFVESGNAESGRDLYYGGFIDAAVNGR